MGSGYNQIYRMNDPTASQSHLSIVPLGAGDLIDRAVRFYRQNFWTFVWIAAPPVVVGTIFSVGWTIVGREVFSVGLSHNPSDVVIYYLFAWLGTIVIWLT